MIKFRHKYEFKAPDPVSGKWRDGWCWLECLQDWVILEEADEPDAPYEDVQHPQGVKYLDLRGKAIEVPDPTKPAWVERIYTGEGYRGLRVVDAMPNLAVQLKYDCHIPNPADMVLIYHDAGTDEYEQWVLNVGRSGEFERISKIIPLGRTEFLERRERYLSAITPQGPTGSQGRRSNSASQRLQMFKERGIS